MHLHNYLVSCSYDEVLWFKRPTALRKYYDMCRQEENPIKSDGLGQVIADNIGAELSIPTGQVSTNGLATIETNAMNQPMLSQMPCMLRLSKADMSLFIRSEEEDEIIRYVFSTTKPLLSHIADQLLFPKQWQGSHACALWSSFCHNKHSVQHEAESVVYCVYLQHRLWYYKSRDLVESHIKWQYSPEAVVRCWTKNIICKSFRYCCPIHAVVKVLVQTITMNISGNNVERRLVIIIFIFYYLPCDFCGITK